MAEQPDIEEVSVFDEFRDKYVNFTSFLRKFDKDYPGLVKWLVTDPKTGVCLFNTGTALAGVFAGKINVFKHEKADLVVKLDELCGNDSEYQKDKQAGNRMKPHVEDQFRDMFQQLVLEYLLGHFPDEHKMKYSNQLDELNAKVNDRNNNSILDSIVLFVRYMQFFTDILPIKPLDP